MNSSATLRIGTCSWKYGSWKGLVYSADKGINFLAEYAQHYDTVEVDQWFWSLHGPGKITLPRRDVVEEYAAAVPEGFRFSVKAPNSVTLSHYPRRGGNEPLVENSDFLSPDLFMRFLESLEPMGSRLGPVMLQFEYLNRDKMPSRSVFFELLDEFAARLPGGFLFGIESRNPNYLVPEYFELLNKHRLHHVYLQGYYMPPVVEVFGKQHASTARTVVLRLHGPDRKGIEERSGGEWNSIIDPKDGELPELIEMIRSLLSRDIDVYLNVNNHYEGSAPLTIQKIRALLSDQD